MAITITNILINNLALILCMYVAFVILAVMNKEIRKFFIICNVAIIALVIYVFVSKLNSSCSFMYQSIKSIILGFAILFDTIVLRLGLNNDMSTKIVMFAQAQSLDFYLYMFNSLCFGDIKVFIRTLINSLVSLENEELDIELIDNNDYLVIDDNCEKENINNLYCVYRL